jgi:cell division protein FtsI (penicillin-binding protein 3)
MWTRGSSERRAADRRGLERRLSRLLAAFGTRRGDLNPLGRTDRPDEAFETGWRRTVRLRGAVVLCGLGLWGVVLQGRLVHLQVVRHDDLQQQALRQQQDARPLEAQRGDIVDRQGRLLAYSVDAERIGIFPRLTEDRARTVAAVCAALGDCTREERAKLLRDVTTRSTYTPVRRARSLAPEQVARVRALGLRGVAIDHDTRRFYPARDLAAHVLGYVSSDNRGIGGLEHVYDKTIRGVAGEALVSVDANRTAFDSIVRRDPVPGATLELTIDLEAQHVAERELRAGVEASDAKGGTAIVMNPYTGAILAVASYPAFNPNHGRATNPDAELNRAIQTAYEPGSTFKIVTAAAALEERVVRPEEIIDTGPGFIAIPGRARLIKDDHPIGAATFEQVVVNSSNVGSVKVAQRLGVERMVRYVERFGFGERRAPDFSGVSAGLWDPNNLGASGLASVAMGYQIGVTPLQMVTAVSAVANGGLLMEPRVVGAVIRGGRREPIAPRTVRRVVEPSTAATLTAMLEGVVTDGTGKAAAIPGFMAAGKTGTAKKAGEGGYGANGYMGSFVGFVPSRRPEYTILVVIDTPRKGSYYGGVVAAPVFRRIAEALLLRAGVAPTINPEPPIVVAAGAPRRPVPVAPRTPAILPVVLTSGGPALTPDVRGLSLRQAVGMLQQAGIAARVSGHGRVVRQTPSPGSPVDTGAWSAIELSRDLTMVAPEGQP